MRPPLLAALAVALPMGLSVTLAARSAVAAGGGAGAGGAGSQRAINSGLPAGEAGPAGASNNRGGPTPDPAPIRGTPRPEAQGGAASAPAR